MALPTQAELLARFTYDPETGVLRHHVKHLGRSRRHAGKVAGSKQPNGHLYVGLSSGVHQVSHLVYKMLYGTEPEYVLHINDDPLDNRQSNLIGLSDMQARLLMITRRWLRNPKQGVMQRFRLWVVTGRTPDLGKFRETYETESEALNRYAQSIRELWDAIDMPMTLDEFVRLSNVTESE